MGDDFVTGREFSNWMQEQSDFRTRLEKRIADQHGELVVTLRRIEDQVLLTNGRTRANGEAISSITTRLDRIDEDDAKIGDVVNEIRESGCSRFAAHQTMFQQAPETWSIKKKATIAGGLLLGGTLTWPGVVEIAKAAQALIGWVASK